MSFEIQHLWKARASHENACSIILGGAANTSSYGISHDRRARVTHDWRADMLVLESESLSYYHSIS